MAEDIRCIAFDVETPNRANDRISAIGVTVVQGGQLAGQYHWLVNPEAPFDPFNIRLTGITPAMAAQAPTFDRLWERLEPILSGGLLIAHNAPFDLSVLGRCLQHYGISWGPTVPYACTCQMSRRLLPGLPNHRLDTLCRHLQLPLEHHNAGSDSCACGQILLCLLQSGAALSPFVRTYDLGNLRTLPRASHGRRRG